MIYYERHLLTSVLIVKSKENMHFVYDYRGCYMHIIIAIDLGKHVTSFPNKMYHNIQLYV
jgi:hypothetical protein